jgi:hypothetical protein
MEEKLTKQEARELQRMDPGHKGLYNLLCLICNFLGCLIHMLLCHIDFSNASCVRARGIAFAVDINVTVGDGLSVNYLGRKVLCILRGAMEVRCDGAKKGDPYITVSACVAVKEDIPQGLTNVYKPMPLLRRFAPYSSPHRPSLVPLNNVRALAHLPHACAYERDGALLPCTMEGGKILHSPTNDFVIHNTLLVHHEYCKVKR